MTAVTDVAAAPGALTRVRERVAAWRAGSGDAVVVAGAVVTMLVVIRVLGAGWRGGFVPSFPDSASYLKVATLGPFRLSFWFGERPVALPALYWLLGRNVVLIVLVQTTVYLGVVWWAIIATWQRCRSSLARWVAVVLIAAVSVQSRFLLWTTQVLSESLSITLGAAAVLGWLAFADRGGAQRCRRAFALTALWALCRDSNVPIAVLSTVPLALLLARHRAVVPDTRRALVRGAAAMLIVLGYVSIASSASDRTIYPTLNVIGQRVLVDSDLTEWYRGWGMPTDPNVMVVAGQSSFDHDFEMLHAPELQGLRDWAEGRGRIVQAWSMVRFAPDFIRDVWHDLGAELRTDHSSYDTFGVSSRVPDRMPLGLDGPRSTGELAVWLVLALAAIAWTAVARRAAVALVLLVALVGSFADLYMSWLGDSVEVQRHLVGAIARLTLVLAFAIVQGVDAAATHRSMRRRSTT